MPADRDRALHPLLAGLLSVLLLVGCGVIAVNCYVSLFGGPEWIWVAFFLSVLVAVGSVFLVVTGRVPADPQGLSVRLPWLKVLDVPVQRIGQVVAITWVIGVPTLFFADGYFVYGLCESGPVFAPREEYRLVNHGRVTEVSRPRFLVVGTSAMVLLHATALAATLFPLYTFLFGDRFEVLKEGKPAKPARWRR